MRAWTADRLAHLAELRHVCETQLAQGRHFVLEHFENDPTWGLPRMTALREHPRCGAIPGKRGALWQESAAQTNRPNIPAQRQSC